MKFGVYYPWGKKNGKSTNEIKSNQEWDKFDNETSEANAKIFNII